MHELSICRAIRGIVEQHAGDRQVEVVRIQVGQLRQIVPDTLVYCWSLTNVNTVYSNTQLDEPVLICSSCGGSEVELVTGEEFLITSLEVAARVGPAHLSDSVQEV
jgi:hydrogenase nickel incorporation protein HypA/HybF